MKETMEDIENSHILSLKEQFKEIIELANNFGNQIVKLDIAQRNRLNEYTYSRIISSFHHRLFKLCKEYNSVLNDIKKILINKNIELTLEKINPSARDIANADILTIRSKRAITFIERIISPLSSNILDKLDSIRYEINADIENVKIKQNLLEAVKEFESTHFLASCLISARTIDHSISAVPILDNSKGIDKISQRIQYLISKGIIDTKREDIKSFVIKAAKKARDTLSHKIDIFIDASDALSLLGDSVKITKIIEMKKI